MDQPQGFVQDASLVCKLLCSLYGLKQAPQAWYEKMDSFLLSTSFTHCNSNPIVYIYNLEGEILILVLYVDDFLITSSSSSMIQHAKHALMEQFKMTDLGLLYYFIGLQVIQSSYGISIYQQKYALDMLQHFGMLDYKPTPTPFQSGVILTTTCPTPSVDSTLYWQLVGNLLYLTHTHPNISFVVGLVA